jgi:acyl carrier protein
MDAALQIVAGMSSGMITSNEQSRLSVTVEEVDIFQPLITHGYAYVTNQDQQHFQVAILDETGLVRVSMRCLEVASGTLLVNQEVTVSSRSPQTQKTPPQRLIKKDVKHLIEETIVEYVGQFLEMSPTEINLEKSFSEYGVDSVIGITLINKINEAFDITLSTTALFNYVNVKALSDYIYDE